MRQHDAIVVGSGPNGLAAAVELARHGRSVLVLEAEDRIGGGTRTEELTEPGFRHDVCSAIHPLGIASPFFASLPLDEHGLEWIHPRVPLAHPLEGTAAVIHDDIDTTAVGLGADASGYARLARRMVDDWEAILEAALGPVVRMPSRPVKLARFGMRAVLPARTFVRRFEDARTRALFAGLAAHAIAPFSQLLTSAVGLTFIGAAHTTGWPLAAGGSQAIADALVSLLRSLGGEVETGTRITRFEQLPPARAVLFDLSPATTAAIAGDRIGARQRRAIRRFRHGAGVFKIDWALDGPVPWSDPVVAAAGTVHVGGTFEEVAAAEDAVSRGDHPDRPFVLVAQQSSFDPSRAPEGRHTLWGYCHVPRRSTVDMTTAIEAQIERFAPGFRDRILSRHTMGPAALEAHNANYVGGDIAGGAITVRQLLARPTLGPDPYRLGAGIYLCSASTPPGAGVHGMCGYHAARSALRHDLG